MALSTRVHHQALLRRTWHFGSAAITLQHPAFQVLIDLPRVPSVQEEIGTHTTTFISPIYCCDCSCLSLGAIPAANSRGARVRILNRSLGEAPAEHTWSTSHSHGVLTMNDSGIFTEPVENTRSKLSGKREGSFYWTFYVVSAVLRRLRITVPFSKTQRLAAIALTD